MDFKEDDTELWGIETPKLLYHYTTLSGMLGIIRNHCLWATDSRFLNDESEQRYMLDVLKQQTQDALGHNADSAALCRLLEMLPERSDEATYIACFCSDGDSLGQWRGYAGTTGVSLGFDASWLEDRAKGNPIPGFLTGIDYSEESIHDAAQTVADGLVETWRRMFPKGFADWALEKTLANNVTERALKWLEIDEHGHPIPPEEVVEAFAEVSYEFWREHLGFRSLWAHGWKNPVFAEEREWRLLHFASHPKTSLEGVRFREGRGTLVPYIEIELGASESSPLREVVLGPGDQDPSKSLAIRRLLMANDLDFVNVRHSEVPFRP